MKPDQWIFSARLFLNRVAYKINRPQHVITQFQRLFYGAPGVDEPWKKIHWLGVETLKCPLDLWIFQEIIWERRPDWIIECGTYKGGSALFLASICELVGVGQVATVDTCTTYGTLPEHPRITYLTGSSISPVVFDQVQSLIKPEDRVMVVLDSDHHFAHVRQELALYSQLVTPGQYLVVEDTNLHGYPVRPDFGPGPMEAVRSFLVDNPQFASDRQREKLVLTFNPEGFLIRIR